jgi:tetratricopeptide (TPR) repeat protein
MMPMPAQDFADALRCHQLGNLSQAEQLYRQILARDQQHPDANHMLGVIAHQVGRSEVAVELIRYAISIRSDIPGYYCNLGLALQSLNKIDEAIEAYLQAVNLNPQLAEAHCVLGNLLRRKGRHADAIAHCRQALRIQPNFAGAHNNLGLALTDLGQMDDALAHFREAVRLNPNYAPGYNNLGIALYQRHKYDEAIDCYRRALQIDPRSAEIHNNLGNVLREQGKLPEAIERFQEALRLKPAYPEAHSNLGAALRNLGRLEEALAATREALRLQPDYAEAHCNLANIYRDRGEHDAASKHYDEAVRIRPPYASAHFNRSMLWLLQGDFARGWPEYEWRWQHPGMLRRSFAPPQWTGVPLEGRTILLHAEQGHGDTLQFIRYAQLVKEQGGRVIVECHPLLVDLLRYTPGVDEVVAVGEALPSFDCHCPLLTLPKVFQTAFDTIPASVPYVYPAPERVAQWRGEIAGGTGLKVGIVWEGRIDNFTLRARTIPLEFFTRLAGRAGISCYSLQTSDARNELSADGSIVDLGSRLSDFHDTAAVIQNLDLVITSDTAVAHLAGALGAPTWVALPFAPDWRWLLDRDDSPWYPSMRLFRQPRPGDWESVFARITTALQSLRATAA